MLRALFFLIFGSLVISALISPSIFIIIKNFFPMLPWPYSRLFDRVLMVVIFIFLLILRKDFSIPDAINKFKEMPKRKALKEIIIALNISLGISIVLAFFLNMQDRLLWEAKDISYYLGKIPKAILSALVISILEESFFRVVLFNSFKKKLNIFYSDECF